MPGQHPEQPPHSFLRDAFHQHFGKRRGELALAPAHRLDAVHEVDFDVAIARERQHMIIEIRRARSRDGDLFRPCRSGREQPAHPAERLDHFVMRVGT